MFEEYIVLLELKLGLEYIFLILNKNINDDGAFCFCIKNSFRE
jgi:hypothetical protein